MLSTQQAHIRRLTMPTWGGKKVAGRQVEEGGGKEINVNQTLIDWYKNRIFGYLLCVCVCSKERDRE